MKKRMLAAILIAGTLGMCGCDIKIRTETQDVKSASNPKTYEFRDYGCIAEARRLVGYKAITQLKVADLDGDGDLDIIMGTDEGEILAYENKMHQKRRN